VWFILNTVVLVHLKQLINSDVQHATERVERPGGSQEALGGKKAGTP
jgi:hypothetical protein